MMLIPRDTSATHGSGCLPFIPFTCEAHYGGTFGRKGMVSFAPWPEADRRR